MRLLLKLKALKNVIQNKQNNSKFYTGMHGWIYRKLKHTSYSEMYSMRGFKKFCFSNIYPVRKQKINENEEYKIWISSPEEMLMVNLISNINHEEQVNLGEFCFQLISMKPVPSRKIDDFFLLKTETITNICLPVNGSLKPKAITLKKDKEKFLEQLRKNLIRKYNYFSEEEIDESFDLWNNVLIKEIPDTECAVRLNFVEKEDRWFDVIGSRYEFNLGKLDEIQKKVFQLCFDLGFGERNSFGFGFVNGKRLVRDD